MRRRETSCGCRLIHAEINPSRSETTRTVMVRSTQEAIVVNLPEPEAGHHHWNEPGYDVCSLDPGTPVSDSQPRRRGRQGLNAVTGSVSSIRLGLGNRWRLHKHIKLRSRC